MKPISSPITLPCVHTTTLLDKDVHLREIMVAQQQAAMDKKQIREELFDLTNRINWLKDRTMERQVEPTEPSSSQRHQRVLLQPPRQDHTNIMIPSLHPVLSQQDVWETWNRDHSNSHDNEDNTEITTLEMLDDEADLATILDLPPANSEGKNITDDDIEVATDMTEIDMTGDFITMYEDVTTINMQELHTSMNKEDILAKKELPANNTHPYDGKHVTNLGTRSADMHMDTKIDMTTKTILKEMKNEPDQRGTEELADDTYLQAMNETYQAEDVDKTYPETNTKNLNIMRGLHTRDDEEDLFTKRELPAENKAVAVYEYKEEPDMQDVPRQEELPADNKVVTKSKYEGVPDVKDSATVPDVQDMPSQEELLADNGTLTKYEYSHSKNMMTSKAETTDIAKMPAYMDEAYKSTPTGQKTAKFEIDAGFLT
jgi:hypothetical protein